MDGTTGQALVDFDAKLARFRAAVKEFSMLDGALFDGAQEWIDLLAYKLVPHFAGEGCLVVAVMGGTNTGKSTVFNQLAGRAVSPVVATAAATRHPVAATAPARAAQCLEGKLVPEFNPLPLTDDEGPVSRDYAPHTLFVASCEHLPESLLLLDTPDVDSIEKAHWAVAESIRAAGDVMVAVLTGEKYRDEQVVAFFRRALQSGRVVVPVMNKADPANDFAMARKQLAEFQRDVGFDGPGFVIAHDFDVNDSVVRARSLDGATDLHGFLAQLDVQGIKQRVYRATVRHFAEQAGAFLDRATELGDVLARGEAEMLDRGRSYARRFNPIPGPEIGGLFHEFVQRRRGPLRRWIGRASRAAATGATTVARTLTRGVSQRSALEPGRRRKKTDAELYAVHRQAVEEIARDLAASYVESARNLREPVGSLLAAGVERVDMDRAVDAVVRETLHSERISDEYRAYANRLLDKWWNENKGRRRALEALDGLLAVVPAAIAAPISVYTGGIGVPEAVTVAGPFVEQFVARVLEYQFGDAMFDFLSPWREDQRANLRAAIENHLAGPCLADMRRALAPFESGLLEDMRRIQQQCIET